MTAYYNEHDPKKAAWLRELIAAGVIAPGIVDERSIEDVLPSELVQFTQCHFFAGIGIWSYALRQAGWPDDRPVWTGSCPCQPFSTAGKREGLADQRHLWPTWNKLIGEAKPPIIFGEQVASSEVVGSRLEIDFALAVRQRNFARANKLAKRLVRSPSFHYWPRWISIVQGDLGAQNYTVRLGVLGAHSVGAPHIRQRLYFVAESIGQQEQSATAGRLHPESGGSGPANQLANAENSDGGSGERGAEAGVGPDGERRRGSASGGNAGILGDAESERQREARASGGRSAQRSGVCGREEVDGTRDAELERSGRTGELGDADATRSQGRRLFTADRSGDSADQCAAGQTGPTNGFWRDAEWIYCRDGKWRPTQPSISPLVNGAAERLVRSSNPSAPLDAGNTAKARTLRLRGYGDGIVAPLAVEFIRAAMEWSA